MPKNIHTYSEKLNALWDQMRHTVEYLIRCNGREWVINNCSKAIEIDNDIGVPFLGSVDEVAAAVDDLVLKAQRKAHNDPNYTL